MAFIAPNGDEWLSEEIYENFCSKRYKAKEVYHSPHRNAIRGLCQLCKNRKAVTRSYRDDKVCQNCNLQIIDYWR